MYVCTTSEPSLAYNFSSLFLTEQRLGRFLRGMGCFLSACPPLTVEECVVQHLVSET